MKKLMAVAIVLVLSLASAPVFAQSSGAGTAQMPKVLTQPIIDRFIADLPGLVKDLKTLGDEYKGENGKGSGGPAGANPGNFGKAIAAMRADSRAMDILNRHGWHETFWQVYVTIFYGYFIAMMDEANAKSPQPAMQQYADQYRAMINPADAALVAGNKDRLKQVLESVKN